MVIVLGPSGSGKSTLCRTINRLEPIDSGTIAVDGETYPRGQSTCRTSCRRRDGLSVFQPVRAQDDILENVMLAPMKVRKAKRTKPRRPQALLERVGIANQADKYPAQLSGGKQLLAPLADCSRSCRCSRR